MSPATIVLIVALAACGWGEAGPTPARDASAAPTATPSARAEPRNVAITVHNAATGERVAGAYVEAAAVSTTTDAAGEAMLTLLPGSEIRVAAAGHDAASVIAPADGPLNVRLRPNVLRGAVADAAGEPVRGVRVFVDGTTTFVTTDAHGAYELRDVPEAATIVFKRGGYRLAIVDAPAEMRLDVALERFDARALYAPAGTFETPGRLEEIMALVEATEINALVIDVKETEGVLMYDSELPAALEAGAVRERPVLELDTLLPRLRERGIYTIARLVVMKDEALAAARPELAVRDTATGGPWRDNLGEAWLDPAAPGVAEYAAGIAAELAQRGFDEVQLDYIRFYSDGPSARADTNIPNTQALRLPAIRHVVRSVADALATERTFLSADVFPISFILDDDQGIGQRPEVFMPYVDYVSPMAYPSHYGPMMFGLPVPNEHPYEVVDQTMAVFNEHAAEWGVAIRPWIQDFGYARFPPYTPEQVQAQMDAAEARGAHGWMIWNPQGRFSDAALRPPRPGEAAGPSDATGPSATPAP